MQRLLQTKAALLLRVGHLLVQKLFRHLYSAAREGRGHLHDHRAALHEDIRHDSHLDHRDDGNLRVRDGLQYFPDDLKVGRHDELPFRAGVETVHPL